MRDQARYAPSGPDVEAAIEVSIEVANGTIYLRLPFSTLSGAYGTSSESRDDMFKTFAEKNPRIWPKVSRKVSAIRTGEVYTVTLQDLA